MRQLLAFIAICIGVAMLSGCDTEKSRKSKAEDVIKQDLFETLPDFDSYQSISLELDTIKEDWLSIPGIIDIAWDYKSACDMVNEINNELQSREQKLANVQEEMKNGFWSGQINFGEAYNKYATRLVDMDKNIESIKRQREQINSHVTSMSNIIKSKYDSIPDKGKFQGWHATHKFRTKDMMGNPFISTRHYYLSPDLTQIIIRWDEDGEDADTGEMLSLVNELIHGTDEHIEDAPD